MVTGPRLKVSSDRLVKPGIEPATPGLQGKLFIHYTTAAPILGYRNLLKWDRLEIYVKEPKINLVPHWLLIPSTTSQSKTTSGHGQVGDFDGLELTAEWTHKMMICAQAGNQFLSPNRFFTALLDNYF